MIIGVAGAGGTLLCQIDAVRAGLQDLGHEVVEWDDPRAEFVFVGNPPFSQYIDIAARKPTIFNVLDLAPHCVEHKDIVASLSIQLPKAAAVTTISHTVRAQLADLCGVKAHTIYYPMKPVTNGRHGKLPYRVALLGRTGDPNKRCGAAVMALIGAGFKEHEVAIVGPEYPGWGSRVGLVPDETLNEIYGSVEYVLMLSKEEGIGLPACETACAGAIPIVAPDLSTYDEFWSKSPMHPFYRNLKSVDAISALLIYLQSDPDAKESLRVRMAEYGTQHLRPLFDRTKVAARILDIYHGLKSA